MSFVHSCFSAVSSGEEVKRCLKGEQVPPVYSRFSLAPGHVSMQHFEASHAKCIMLRASAEVVALVEDSRCGVLVGADYCSNDAGENCKEPIS